MCVLVRLVYLTIKGFLRTSMFYYNMLSYPFIINNVVLLFIAGQG